MRSPALRYARANSGLTFRPNANTVLWLPGQDDAYSATIRDRSGQGNDGTITGATWARTGQGLWYLSFDGVDDRIQIADNAILYNASLTVLLWARRDNRNDIHYLLENHDANIPRIYWSNASDILVPSSGTTYVDTVQTTTATQQVWHFIVVTGFDFSGASGGAYWGWRQDGADDYLGDMALQRFIARTLSVAEIISIYNQERHHFGR